MAPHSLRGRFLLIVTAGVVLPLALTGFWLTGSASRSGRELLGARLDAGLAPVVADAGARWIEIRAELLDIAEDAAVRTRLRSLSGDAEDTASQRIAGLSPAARDMGRLAGALLGPITLRNLSRDVAWTVVHRDGATEPAFEIVSSPSDAFAGDGISVSLPLYDDPGGVEIGRLESRVSFESIVPTASSATAVGSVLLVTDRLSGTSRSELLIDPSMLAQEDFDLAGEHWLVRRRTLEEPALILASAAPLAAYTLPFEEAARKGLLSIIAVAISTLCVASLLTRRLTRSLEALAVATDAVADGDLDRQVSERGDDEVGRVGRAFNAMTESLRVTIRQLAQREALAAVGEFASSLAHEVRNPLTSIRIDLQSVEEKLPDDSPLRQPLARALREVQRLDGTVSGSLKVARSGRIDPNVLDLWVPLQRAIEVATPAFDQRGARLGHQQVGVGHATAVRGDESALEQLFLNILLNAAQAVGGGGNAEVTVTTDATHALVQVRDSGPGIPADLLAHVFEPFFSTKEQGTGLGLSVARQIVSAHAGTIEITSAPATGTCVSVRLYLHA
ncbi:MAG: ATP-binding protein [Gemmatimonadales bacterium]